MQLLKPLLCEEFQCIANKCDYTCCKGWGIPFTKQEYDRFLQQKVHDIERYSERNDDNSRKMKLRKDGSCPYLMETGLCDMIIRHGEDILCEICEKFPRIQSRKNNVYEYGLSNACPAVIQILEKTPSPIIFQLNDINEAQGEFINADANLVKCRDLVIDLLQIQDFPLWIRLYLIYSLAYKVGTEKIRDYDVILQRYSNVSYLYEIFKQLMNVDYNMDVKLKVQYDFIRQVRYADIHNPFEKYCLELFRYAESLEVESRKADWEEFQNVEVSYESLLENIAVNHAFVKLDCSDNKKFQYSVFILVEEISLIKFTMYLDWLYKKKQDISDDVKQITCYYARRLEHGIYVSNYVRQLDQDNYLSTGNIFMLVR